MPYFLLTFGDARRPPLAAVIIEAPSTFQARMTAVVRRLDFKLSAEMMKTIPPEEIGRMMCGVEAAELIVRQARQAKMLTKDEEHRAVTNIAKLRQLRGRRDGDT